MLAKTKHTQIKGIFSLVDENMAGKNGVCFGGKQYKHIRYVSYIK
jgi:hypothetical protein